MRNARLLTVSRTARRGGSNLPPQDAEPPGHVTCGACWEAKPHTANRMTHSCKNITLPHTSFAGGKNTFITNIKTYVKTFMLHPS